MYSALRVVAVVGVVVSGAAKCEAPTRNIVFPVGAKVSYTDTFGAPRSGGRHHEGQDLMGTKGMPLIAAVDGTVRYLKYSASGLSGNMLQITDADGWSYSYIHVNNDSPGTDDARNVYEQAFVDGIRAGQKVKAGEPVAYLGDSGNAESTAPHLHFEIRDPNGVAVNAYSSLKAATHRVESAAEIAAAAPRGVAELIESTTPGTIHASGWAIDRVVETPVPVSLYVDGTPVLTDLADVDRNDLPTDVAHTTALHGFDVTASGIAAGSHTVCLILHNAGDGGGSARTNCTTVAVG